MTTKRQMMNLPANYLSTDDLSGKCYLCMLWDRKTTPEHVMPQWLSEYLRPKISALGFSWNTPEGRVLADKWTWTVPVCKPCNDWMNEHFEEYPTKSLIQQLVLNLPSLEHLTRAQQARIARWSVKTAIMVDAYESKTWGTDIRAPRGEVEFLYVHGVPSTHTALWIGQLAAPYTTAPPPENLRPKSDLRGHVVVPEVTWAPIHVIHQWVTLIVHQPTATNWAIDLPVEFKPYLTRIWPPREGMIDWPPPIVVDRPTYEAILRVDIGIGPGTIEPEVI
jgi:hypothetical protein